MGDRFFTDGVEKIYVPDEYVTMSEVAADVAKEQYKTKEGKRVSRHNEKMRRYSIRLVEPHTLEPADDHKHHLVITTASTVGSTGKKHTRFVAYCKICRKPDTWAVEDTLPVGLESKNRG